MSSWNRLSAVALAAGLAGCGGQQTRSTAEPTPPAAQPTAEKPKESAPAEKPGATDVPEQKVDEAPEVRDVAKSLLEAGREAAASGDLAAAKARFEEAAQSDPSFAEAHYNLAVLREWQGDYAGARQGYEATLLARPDFGPAIIAVANLMLRQGDASGALRYAEQKAAANPESNGLANALNHVRLATGGQAQQVITSCKQVLRRDERNVQAMKILAAAYARQGKHELAIAILKNARELDGEDPDIDYRIALSHQAMKEDIKAQVALERAVRHDGGAGPEAHNNLGLIYARAGDFAGAEDQYRKALNRWPDMLSAQVNLGNALKGQQKFTEAMAAFKKAEALSPNAPEVLYNLGIFYLDAAVPDLDPELRLNQAVRYLEQYKPMAQGDMKTRVEGYLVEARKRIIVEQKRKEQMRNTPKAPTEPEATSDDAEAGVEGEADGSGEDAAEPMEDAPAEGGEP